MKLVKFSQAINDAIRLAMKSNSNVICYGLGVTDPAAVFGTTKGLAKEFGDKRVFDTPTSENAMTGVGIGASLNQVIPIMTHQRLDFFLLALDQLINGAAKWYYMFGGQISVPITIRLIIGRGWGQGPTHSQNLQSWFAHIPGLKVVMPSNPSDAKGLLLSSIFDPNPVIFLEHRWLHSTEGIVTENETRIPIGNAHVSRKGNDLTIVASSYMVVEAIHASKYLAEHGISCELIDLRTIKPLDWATIFNSVEKTGRLLVVDSGYFTGSIASEIIAAVSIQKFSYLKSPPAKLAMPDVPEPTSQALTKNFYIRASHIVEMVINTLEIDKTSINYKFQDPDAHDIPGDWFSGPF